VIKEDVVIIDTLKDDNAIYLRRKICPLS